MSSILSNCRLLSVIWTRLFEHGPNVYQHLTFTIPFLYVYFVWEVLEFFSLRTEYWGLKTNKNSHHLQLMPWHPLQKGLKKTFGLIFFGFFTWNPKVKWFCFGSNEEKRISERKILNVENRWTLNTEHSFQFVFVPLDWVTYRWAVEVFLFLFLLFISFLFVSRWIHLTRNPICAAVFHSKFLLSKSIPDKCINFLIKSSQSSYDQMCKWINWFFLFTFCRLINNWICFEFFVESKQKMPNSESCRSWVCST